MDRLQKLIAGAGFCSRREAETWIRSGRVRINGRMAVIGESADLATDQVQVDGRPLNPPGEHTYLLLNKPGGIITTMKDPHSRRTVAELVTDCPERVAPVGRLDRDTLGLLLLTNDGELAFRLSHPRYGIEKVYRALVRGKVRQEELDTLRTGVTLDDGLTAPARVRIKSGQGETSVVELAIHEGRNRQIRRMLDAVGHPVVHLERIQYGPIRLGSLRPGEWRRLTSEEVQALKKATRLG